MCFPWVQVPAVRAGPVPAAEAVKVPAEGWAGAAGEDPAAWEAVEPYPDLRKVLLSEAADYCLESQGRFVLDPFLFSDNH